jgi:hypothetical protein
MILQARCAALRYIRGARLWPLTKKRPGREVTGPFVWRRKLS